MVCQQLFSPMLAMLLLFTMTARCIDSGSMYSWTEDKGDCLHGHEQQAYFKVELQPRKRGPAGPARTNQYTGTLKRIYSRPVVLPEELLHAARMPGNTRRMHGFALKLLLGQPVSVLVIGGSITEGAGVHDFVSESFVWNTFKWLQETFPGAEHILSNEASGGGSSLMFRRCLGSSLQGTNSVDLVVFEFAVNDPAAILHEEARALNYDALVRTLWDLPGSPALLGIHMYSPHFTGMPAGQLKFPGGYTQSAETLHAQILEYYQVPALSVRRMLHHARANAPEGSGFQDNEIWCDVVHPSHLGHIYLADMLISYLQDLTGGVLLHAMHAGGVEKLAEMHEGLAKQPGVLDGWPLPPPFVEGNDVDVSVCLRMDALQHSVVHTQGFEWLDEAKGNRSRWGYIATEPGSTITFRVEPQEVLPCKEGTHLEVALAYMRTYTDVGQAIISCSDGCTCEELEFNAYFPVKGVTVTRWAVVKPTLGEEGVCHVSVQVMDETQSKGHKMKLSAVSSACRAT